MKNELSRPEVVVVTGGSAGVGRATVRAFARRGARIGILARGPEGLQAARREVEAAGGRALVLRADLANAGQVFAAAAAVEGTFGPIDVWVNNAMNTVYSPVKEMTPDEYRRVTEVTYLGAVHGTLAALRSMLKRDSGTIVQVGSALCYRSIPLQSAYCAAKHAVKGFTESLRCELIHDKSKVRLTMVHLPALNTPQFLRAKSRLARKPQPVPPIYEPEVAADAITWAAHHGRREVWVGYSTYGAIWLNRLVPGLTDHYLARTAYEGQQTREPEDPDRPHNLWDYVPGDAGAHGPFGRRSRRGSPLLRMSKHRRAGLALAGLAGGLAAAAALRAEK